MTPAVAWRSLLAADQALLALPRKARDRSEEAELAAEACQREAVMDTWRLFRCAAFIALCVVIFDMRW